ncbi:uncharacterized protein LOC115743530 [Rhodamnia argentea]|uniref:Uncharacterized protein LOC115743530 n=1 Tax=Rhodamnia argentea TaxID=178133 RepID=A0ABM3HBU0_9MYRT|nr:uncharacterized protein LOC115743530 [Rhodamnia argentea]
MHGVVSQGRPAPFPSPSSSPSSSPSLSSHPRPLYADGQHGHIGHSSDPQEHFRRQLGHIRTECTSVPSASVPPSVEQSNDEGNIAEEDSRFVICPYGDSFKEATYVVRELNKIVNNYWRGPWISYGGAPKQVMDLWWSEFKQREKNVKPDFITVDDWTEIKRIWESEKNKQKSEQNVKNRVSTSSEGSATYAGGSINIGEHRKRMAHELGTEPTYAATFERTFQKKDKTWIGDRAKSVKEKYDEFLMSTASGDDGRVASEPTADNMALWVEASGGMKRGKIFGMGSLSRVYTAKAAGSSSSNPDVSRRTRFEEEMTQHMTQLRNLLVQKDEEIKVVKEQMSRKDEQIRLVNERHQSLETQPKSLETQMQLVLQHLNLNQDRFPPVLPTHEIGAGHNDGRHKEDEVAADDDDLVNSFIDPDLG